MSINTLDEDFKNDMDNASSIQDRLNTLKELHNSGIHTVLFMSPIFPYITNFKDIIEVSKEYIDEYWFKSADEDYDTMLYMKEGKKNTWCLFMGHLVIEKLLVCKEYPNDPIAPKIHNLILLSQKANLEVPTEIREKIQTINTFNISARYDDYKRTFDEKYTDDYTSEQVKNVEEVRKWLKEQ